MNIRWLNKWLLKLVAPMLQTPAHRIVRNADYMERWWIWVQPGRDDIDRQVPTSRFSQCYLHRFQGPDDDSALHDHPWWNISIVLSGSYTEVFADRRVRRVAGDIVFRRASTCHRIADVEKPTVTLFITGRISREWGFRTQAGFIPWREYEDHKTRQLSPIANAHMRIDDVADVVRVLCDRKNDGDR